MLGCHTALPRPYISRPTQWWHGRPAHESIRQEFTAGTAVPQQSHLPPLAPNIYAGWRIHRCRCDVCGYESQRTGGSGASVLTAKSGRDSRPVFRRGVLLSAYMAYHAMYAPPGGFLLFATPKSTSRSVRRRTLRYNAHPASLLVSNRNFLLCCNKNFSYCCDRVYL